MYLPPEVPGWCRIRRGGGAVLLVAPHGGCRGAVRPSARPLKVNDLHTAALADELATALDASLIANPALDRNELDLNRISQVARAAPWFPALLEALLADILARHARAQVLFLHGWNTLQPKCDIGIGCSLARAADAAAHAPMLTASPVYVTTRIAALRAACAARGIAAPLGERYPGRHANNVLQLFRRDGRTALVPRLREWIAAGRVDAVQLELAAPLRWPGPLRPSFIAALRETFAAPAARVPAAARPRPSRPTAPGSPPRPVALQAYDPARGIGLVARVDPHGGSGASGRLLLFLGGSQVALFTGEDPQAQALARAGPRFAATGDGLRLSFDGWALCARDGALYVDLEQALAASHLMGVRADLRFARRGGDHGRVRGALVLDGVSHPLDAIGFAPTGGVLQPQDSGWRSHLILRAALPDGTALALRHRVPGGTLLQGSEDPAARTAGAMSVTFDGDPDTPRRIVVQDGGRPVIADTTSRLAIIRPLAAGRRARVTLGIARVTHGDAAGYGFFEYARVL